MGKPTKTATSAREYAAFDVQKWTPTGDDPEVLEETKRRARQCGPEAVAFLRFVMMTDQLPPSIRERVRAAGLLLEVGGFVVPRLQRGEPRQSHDEDEA